MSPPPAPVNHLPLKSTIVMVDPLRTVPPHQPFSIAPQIQSAATTVYRSAAAVTVPASTATPLVQPREATLKSKREQRREESASSRAPVKTGPTSLASSGSRAASAKKGAKRKSVAENHSPRRMSKLGGKMRKRRAQDTLSSRDSLDVNFELPAYFQFGEDPAHHHQYHSDRLPLDHVPQVTKSKKELSSNRQKVNPKARSAQSLNSLARPAYAHPPVTSTKPRKGSVTATVSPRLSPPPAKVQIIDQTMASGGSLPGNGSILFNHLQRKIVTTPSTPSSLASLQAENGFAFRGRERAEEGLSIEDVKIRTIGNGNAGAETRLVASKSDGLLESIIFDIDEEVQDEVVLEEFVEEEVGEGSEGHVLEDLYCELNDTAEIIEEEEEEEMSELDYVTLQEPIEIYGELQPLAFNVIFRTHPLHYSPSPRRGVQGGARDDDRGGAWSEWDGLRIPVGQRPSHQHNHCQPQQQSDPGGGGRRERVLTNQES